MAKLQILVADDSEVIRRGLRTLLGNSDDWEVCGEASDGHDALTKVANLLPDIILLDLSIPVLHGLIVANTLSKQYPALRIVVMSEQDPGILSLLAEESKIPYYLPKSRLAFDLIPMVRSFVTV